jgi:outer membrane protein TolC
MLAQAKTNHIQALYDFNINKAKLDKAIGAKSE